MRTKLLFLAVCAACNMAANCSEMPPDSVIRAELTPEELAQGPTSHQMKGAILNDVRIWRELDKKVLVEGRKEMPKGISYAAGFPICDYDKTDLEIFSLKSDLADQAYRVEETAYLCKKESIYYYHYQGGPRRVDLWMGPYRIDRKRPKTDDQQK
jgi:hypothetical protein